MKTFKEYLKESEDIVTVKNDSVFIDGKLVARIEGAVGYSGKKAHSVDTIDGVNITPSLTGGQFMAMFNKQELIKLIKSDNFIKAYKNHNSAREREINKERELKQKRADKKEIALFMKNDDKTISVSFGGKIIQTYPNMDAARRDIFPTEDRLGVEIEWLK